LQEDATVQTARNTIFTGIAPGARTPRRTSCTAPEPQSVDRGPAPGFKKQSPVPCTAIRFQALLSSLARLRASGTFEWWPGTARIQVSTAPSASHAAQTASSPQLTPGGYPRARASSSRTAPAIHAPAHAAARSQLAGRQPRSLMNPAIGMERERATQTASARTATICTAAGPALNPINPVPAMSAEM